ncbi:hypothetical protein [Actinokineospora pegani]|uniref:hypothetical protein n=1 Tax=Actinokineospora pegani TaxID=2654637 RepID=UPI0012EA495B|nr:hypothetical protein [Actinokineospora pegani]
MNAVLQLVELAPVWLAALVVLLRWAPRPVLVLVAGVVAVVSRDGERGLRAMDVLDAALERERRADSGGRARRRGR